MPILNIKSIHSFSSEDSSFPATNLLSSNTSTTKKWKCKFPGESSIHVVLQLENPSTITAIDIGNEHSAFVDVSVSKKGSSEFKQILLSSSFMSPIESRNSDPVNRVRCFSRSALIEETVESKCKWDLVKISCTQPYNKNVQYGLSFIKLHSSDVKESNEAATSIPLKVFGNFKIREESPDSESESSQSLFARWKASRGDTKEQSQSKPLSAAAAIRNASTTTSLKNHSPQVNRTKITPKRVQNRHNISDQIDEDKVIEKNRNRSEELMYEDEDDKPNEKLDKIILKEKERLEREKNDKRNSDKKQAKNKNTSEVSKSKKDIVDNGPTSAMATTSKMSKHNDTLSEMKDLKVDNNDRLATSSNSKKRQSSPINVPVVKRMKESKEPAYKPFHKLLEGVVLVISGIQNPARAMIRQQAMDMGAKYKPDWEASCTHLICAFKNTPKYNQVHGIGKIITKDWILECYKKKTRLPWRRFALDDDDAEASESEDEVYDKSLKPSQSSSDPKKGPESDIKHQKLSTTPKKLSQSKSPSTSPSKSPMKPAIVLSDDSDDESLDRYNLNSSRTIRNEFVSSGSDTEDEIRRVLEKKSASIVSTESVINSSDDIYNATTEEDTSVREGTSKPITPLPEFFKGKQFYLSRNVSSTDEIKLKRFISIYGGEVTVTASNSDYIVSNSPKETPTEYKGEVVKPLWIFECNDLEMLLPTQRYNFSNW